MMLEAAFVVACCRVLGVTGSSLPGTSVTDDILSTLLGFEATVRRTYLAVRVLTKHSNEGSTCLLVCLSACLLVCLLAHLPAAAPAAWFYRHFRLFSCFFLDLSHTIGRVSRLADSSPLRGKP